MDLKWIFIAMGFLLFACDSKPEPAGPVFQTVDTEFSKGRLTHIQQVGMNDLVKFHGHLCDGLVVGALALEQALELLFPNGPIDRTNIRIVSKPSPCLTDVAIYLTGGRYQFNTFYVDTAFEGMFLIQKIDDQSTVSVRLRPGVKPAEIDSLGRLAVHRALSPCDIDQLQKLEDDFMNYLLQTPTDSLFISQRRDSFTWAPKLKNDYLKTDIVNKGIAPCQ
jgi:acetolactate decarboxylase